MNEQPSIPEVGEKMRCRVIRFHEQGAIVRIRRGVTGLLLGSQMSWVNKSVVLSEALKIGDKLDAEVLAVRHSKKSNRVFISLGHRQTLRNPWEKVEAIHSVGSREIARVVGFLPFGAKVEFVSGFRALVHDSEVSWTERKTKARSLLSVGDSIPVIIQLVDKDRHRIHASYRQAIDNPWETFLDKFPLGSVTVGTVLLTRDYGVLIKLSNGCSGLLHRNDFPSGDLTLSTGDTIGVVIREYDQEKRRVLLGYSSSG